MVLSKDICVLDNRAHFVLNQGDRHEPILRDVQDRQLNPGGCGLTGEFAASDEKERLNMPLCRTDPFTTKLRARPF